MTTNHNLDTNTIRPVHLGKRMLVGAIPALLLVTAFLWAAGKGNPAWSNYWMIRPLVIVPFAGAIGGAVYALLDGMRLALRWNRTLTIFLSGLIYLIGIWMGFVLGFVGTYWN